MKKRVALFPGQGAQYVGMCKKLCEEFQTARDTFEEANDILSFDLKKLCFSGDMNELTQTENAQPAILTASVASYRVLKERTNLRIHYMAGHSLGEISALTCSGAIDFADAVRIVRKRGELMGGISKDYAGQMSAIGKLPRELVAKVCEEISRPGSIVCVSNYNSPKQNVISGHKDAVGEAEKRLAILGASIKRLNVSAPFHSPLLEPIASEFSEYLKNYTYKAPSCIVLSNVTARPYEKDDVIEKLTKQIVSPVRWQDSMQYLREQGVGITIDVGPGKVLRNLSTSNMRYIKALSYDVPDDSIDLENLIKNNPVIPFVSRCMGLAVSTKNMCQNDDDYEVGVIAPYKQLQAMQEQISSEGRNADMDEMVKAKNLLIRIFNTKKISQEEQDIRLKRLYTDTDTESLFMV